MTREKWIVAVSGGVDSVVLLDMLVASQTADLVVAHVDHGIRGDSHEDAVLVEGLAAQYELAFETVKLQLGSDASELQARDKRYEWLESIREQYGATAIATAHHQDDLIETIVINIQRGTGWRGLCSLRDTDQRKRPLLTMNKASIVSYAIERGLEWREDSTNDDVRYMRNYIRHGIIPRLTSDARRELLRLYYAQLPLRLQIEQEIVKLHDDAYRDNGLSRYLLIMAPEAVALELLRVACSEGLLTHQLRQLLLFAKTARVGAVLEAGGGISATATGSRLILER
jgi:tRNA(Ile)-lysidine synthase